MRRFIPGIALACLLAFTAVAFGSATVSDVTQDSVTIRGLKCDTTYRIQVEARNAGDTGWDVPTTQTAKTAACPAAAPVADFSVSPDPAVRNKPTTFTTTGTCAASPCTYKWFHGGTSSTDQLGTGTSATFTYSGAAGPRIVTLKVTDSQNRESVKTRTFQLVEATATPTPSPTPSPTPTPTPTPTSGGSGCALPAFPDASCTGVPAGTSLTPSGGLTISTAGAVIDGREITGQVVVNAPNVTIRRSRIRANSMWVIDNRSTGLVVEDSEIFNRPVSGQNNCHNAIGDANFTVRRSEISGCENAANIGGDNVTFVDNFVHDLDTTGPSYVWGMDPHTDGLQMSPGADNIVVRHNTIDPSPGGGVTSPIIMGVNGSQNNVWIEDNFLDGAGASYAVYLPRQLSQNINVNRNRMTRGAGGYTACAKLGQTVVSFSENRDANTGALIAPDNGAGGSCTN